MNCHECKEQLVPYVEGLVEEATAERVLSHVESCPDCRSELAEVRALCERLGRDGQAQNSVSLDSKVMDEIVREQAREIRRIKMRKRYRVIGAGGAVAAAATVFIGLWLAAPGSRAMAAEVLAKGARAAAGLTSIHIKGRMRTLPRDNFSLIKADGDLHSIELWKEFGDQPRWRIEKPGRVAVMDGESTVMYITGHMAVKGPVRARFDTDWLHDLANVDKIITAELRSALVKDSDLRLTHEKGADGRQKRVVTVEIKAGRDDKDYLKNKFLTTSDNRRVYRFDAESGRLEDLKIYLQRKDDQVLIFEVTQIDYGVQIDPSVWKLDVPKDVVWFEPPQRLPDNEKYEKMTAEEAARAFFGACTKEDWDEAKKFLSSVVSKRMKDFLGGLEIVRIGEPFQSKSYPGWFVPYEIKMKGGHVRKHNLALRKDNPAKRFIVDGGL
jgi:outer membrane lipoprotein-sorting protein